MKIVDLSHVMNVHTPGWVGYAGNKMYYESEFQAHIHPTPNHINDIRPYLGDWRITSFADTAPAGVF